MYRFLDNSTTPWEDESKSLQLECQTERILEAVGRKETPSNGWILHPADDYSLLMQNLDEPPTLRKRWRSILSPNPKWVHWLPRSNLQTDANPMASWIARRWNLWLEKAFDETLRDDREMNKAGVYDCEYKLFIISQFAVIWLLSDDNRWAA